MGNNALKKFGIETVRISKEKYDILSRKIVDALKTKFSVAEPVIAYKSKEDFGDLDVLVVWPAVKIEPCKVFEDLFHFNAIYCNKPVYSFDVDNFQVDVIFVSQELFIPAYVYYAYNDLGNLMGRIAHKMGFKYGHEGLTFPIRDKNQDKVLAELTISTDPPRIFNFLGYDFDMWEKGFNTLEDIFKFAMSSPFFNPTLFEIANLNHENRVRNRKRKSYMSFLKYIGELDFGEKQFTEGTKEQWLDRAEEIFPEVKLKETIEKLRKKDLEIKEVRQKFNGSMIVALYPDIKGKILGKFIMMFKSLHSNSEEEFISYLKTTPADIILSDIKNLYENKFKSC